MSPSPTASEITLSETIRLMDGEFAPVIGAVDNQQFALWVGSGISFGRAPSLGVLLELVIEHLRSRLVVHNTSDKFYIALKEILQKAGYDATEFGRLPLTDPFSSWPKNIRERIVGALWGKYSSVLDVHVEGERHDYLLWNAVDVRKEFGLLANPDSEHLSIAILVLEGAVSKIASANWDGLIEVAIDQLSPQGRNGILQVIVDPAHVRDPPGSASLIKFHGCAVLCVSDENTYRRFLVATKSQITNWPNEAALAALRAEVIAVATNMRALMVGLSLQDSNLQDVFSRARSILPYRWPSAPEAQFHVFCEDQIGEGQDAMLRVVYGADYGPNAAEIRKSALLRAYPKQSLLGLVVRIVTEKLSGLLKAEIAPLLSAPDAEALQQALIALQFVVGDAAPTDSSAFSSFLREIIEKWSRAISIYRSGTVPLSGSEHYHALSPLPLTRMLQDPNVQSQNMGKAAFGLALLARRMLSSGLKFAPSSDARGEDGSFQAIGDWGDRKPAQIFFVRDATIAIRLMQKGALVGENVVVLHSDDNWEKFVGSTAPRTPFGGRSGGRNRVRHVSLHTLLEEASTLADFEQLFVERVTI